MKKIIFVLLSIIPIVTFTKTIDFVNDSNLYMSFAAINNTGDCRVGITPSKFQLLPGNSQKIEINIPECFIGETQALGITIMGWPSKYPVEGRGGFQYLAGFTNSLDGLGQWVCAKDDSKIFSNYCYHVESGKYHDFLLEANQNTIHVNSPTTPPSEDGFYTFFNDTTDTFFSISSMANASKRCSAISIGAFQPKSKYNFSYQEISEYCYKNPKSCKIEIYKDKGCSSYPIGTIVLDIDSGIKSTLNNPHQPGELSYRISYETSATHNGQDLHIAKTIVYGVRNDSSEEFALLMNDDYCSYKDYNLLWPHYLLMLNSPSPKLWYLCNDPTSCKISLHLLKKGMRDCSGPSIGDITIDIDHGIKAVINEPSSKYKISYSDAIPGVSQQIVINKSSP